MDSQVQPYKDGAADHIAQERCNRIPPRKCVDPDTDNYFSGPIQNPHPPIRFAGCVLQESSLLKLVGLTFTSNLTWTKHVNNIYRNASKNIALLHRANLVCSKEALATIYKSHIRSRLEYCCPIWMGSGTTVLSKLDRVQERAGRINSRRSSVQQTP